MAACNVLALVSHPEKNTWKVLGDRCTQNTSPLTITSLSWFGKLRESWAELSSHKGFWAVWSCKMSQCALSLSSLQSAADSMSEFVFQWCRRSPNLSFSIQTILKIMKQSIKKLLCSRVNMTSVYTHSSKKSSKQILGVIWEICVRNRTQLRGKYCQQHIKCLQGQREEFIILMQGKSIATLQRLLKPNLNKNLLVPMKMWNGKLSQGNMAFLTAATFSAFWSNWPTQPNI